MSAHQQRRLPKFIAVTGREACGKDSYADHLAELGYLHISAGNFLRARAYAQGYADPVPREVLSRVGDELKREFGPSPITEGSLAQYEAVSDKYPVGLVISGFRRAGEVQAFKKHGAIVLWVEASAEKRFANQASRSRGDEQNWEDFMARGNKEYYGDTSGGQHGVNLQAVEALADCRVENNSTQEELFIKADEALSKR